MLPFAVRLCRFSRFLSEAGQYVIIEANAVSNLASGVMIVIKMVRGMEVLFGVECCKERF